MTGIWIEDDSRDSLATLAKRIVEEAIAATKREAESYRQALEAQAAENGESLSFAEREAATATRGWDDQLDGWLDGRFDWIPPYFDEHAIPEPQDFDDTIEKLSGVAAGFGAADSAEKNPDLSRVDKAQSEIEEWKGAYGENLQNNVLLPLPDIVENHGKIALTLQETMDGTKNIYSRKRRDLLNLASSTITALKACGTRDGAEDRLGLTVAAALTSAAAAVLAVPTGGTSLYAGTVALATISSAGYVAAARITDSPEVELSGNTVNAVLESMVANVELIADETASQEDKVIEACTKNYELLTGLRQWSNSTGKVSPVMPLRPRIADATNPEDGLEPETSQ